MQKFASGLRLASRISAAARRAGGAGGASGVGGARVTQPLSTVAEIFKSMEYGPAPEDDSGMAAWLAAHDHHFGMFIDGEWRHPEGRSVGKTYCPATGDQMAFITQANKADADDAVAAAHAAFPAWSALAPHERAKHLYSIARHIQKHHRLLAVVEAMDNGKTVREARDSDAALAIRHFYSCAGWAQLFDTEFAGYKPLGVIGQIVPWNFPLLMLAWKIAPAIAMGNCLVLKPASYTRLSAFLMADIIAESGLPKGVVNIISGPTDMATHLVEHEDVQKVAFTGSTGIGQFLRRKTAGTGKKLTLELGGKSPVVVFDSADQDGAVEGIVQAIWFNQGQVCCAGSRLLVQENIAPAFINKLKARMQSLRIGHSLDKCLDMGPVVDQNQWDDIDSFVKIGREEGAEIYQVDVPETGIFYPPTLVTGVGTASTLVQEEIFGPVLVVQTFRTPAEAVALANNSKFGLGASVWSENLGLALEAAVSIKAGSMWVNCHNMFDAAAGFGGYKESGYGREGGREGMLAYCKHDWMPKFGFAPRITDAMRENDAWGKAALSVVQPAGKAGGPKLPTGIDRTPKMYVGGKQDRPDGRYSKAILSADGSEMLGSVGDGNRKDVRNAVEAAHAAAGGWGKRAAHDRAQICFYIAENLSARADEFAARIAAQTGRSSESAMAEVEASISRLFTYAAYADKFGGEVQETPLYGMTAKIHEPVGVIGIACPTELPLLGFISLVAPAIVRGNTIVAVPSEDHPLSATDLYQVLDTSDLPGGVINIVTGQRDLLTKTLVEHQHVDAMWYFGDVEGCYHVERLSAGNMKRTFVSYGYERDWFDPVQGEGMEFLHEAIEVKNIWVPMGEQY